MSVGQVEQVPQSAAPPVPPLVADAVFQHHIVGSNSLQDIVYFLWGAAGVHLIHLFSHTHTHISISWKEANINLILLGGENFSPGTQLPDTFVFWITLYETWFIPIRKRLLWKTKKIEWKQLWLKQNPQGNKN